MVIIYMLILVFFLPKLSWGYVDPGSITIFLQVIIAFVVGALISFRTNIFTKVKNILSLITQRKKSVYEKQSNPNKD